MNLTNKQTSINNADDFYHSFYYNLLTAMTFLQKWLLGFKYNETFNVFHQACDSILKNFYFTNSKALSTQLLIRSIETLPNRERQFFVYVIQDFLMTDFTVSLGGFYDKENLKSLFESLRSTVYSAFDVIFSKELLSYFLSIIYNPNYGINFGFNEKDLFWCTDFGYYTEEYGLGRDYRNLPIGSIWHS